MSLIMFATLAHSEFVNGQTDPPDTIFCLGSKLVSMSLSLPFIVAISLHMSADCWSNWDIIDANSAYLGSSEEVEYCKWS